MWGFVLSLINIIVTLVIVLFMLLVGVADGVFQVVHWYCYCSAILEISK